MTAIEVFVACDTQWRRDHRGWLAGLDYPGVHHALQMMHADMDNAHVADTFERVRILEQATREALSEKHGKQN